MKISGIALQQIKALYLEQLQWLDSLLSESGRRVFCSADFMGVPRRLLEAERKTLYEHMPVPLEWHQEYAE